MKTKPVTMQRTLVEIHGVEIEPLKAAKAIAECMYWEALVQKRHGEGMNAVDREYLVLLQGAFLDQAQADLNEASGEPAEDEAA